MFLIKSTFWLGLAIVVIQPQGIDFNSKKEAISSAALNVSQKVLTSQMEAVSCQTLQCSGTKAFLLASNNKKFANDNNRTPNNALPMQEVHSQIKAPIPKPRLKRSG